MNSVIKRFVSDNKQKGKKQIKNELCNKEVLHVLFVSGNRYFFFNTVISYEGCR